MSTHLDLYSYVYSYEAVIMRLPGANEPFEVTCNARNQLNNEQQFSEVVI